MKIRGGYSLIELMVVLGILALLAQLALPLATMQVQRERERELHRAVWELRDAIDAYQRASLRLPPGQWPTPTGYPRDLQALLEGQADPSLPGGRRRFLRRIPRDPFADPKLPAEQTWALRSYASTADAPMPGDDVYDVYSRAAGKGLNGLPLRQW